MNKSKKGKIKPIKAWAVFKKGKIIQDDFFVRKSMPKFGNLLAIFPNKRWTSGYVLNNEKLVRVLITPLP